MAPHSYISTVVVSALISPHDCYKLTVLSGCHRFLQKSLLCRQILPLIPEGTVLTCHIALCDAHSCDLTYYLETRMAWIFLSTTLKEMKGEFRKAHSGQWIKIAIRKRNNPPLDKNLPRNTVLSQESQERYSSNLPPGHHDSSEPFPVKNPCLQL